MQDNASKQSPDVIAIRVLHTGERYRRGPEAKPGTSRGGFSPLGPTAGGGQGGWGDPVAFEEGVAGSMHVIFLSCACMLLLSICRACKTSLSILDLRLMQGCRLAKLAGRRLARRQEDYIIPCEPKTEAKAPTHLQHVAMLLASPGTGYCICHTVCVPDNRKRQAGTQFS